MPCSLMSLVHSQCIHMCTNGRSFCRFYTCIWVDAMNDKHQAFHLRMCPISEGSCRGDRGRSLLSTYTITVMVLRLPAELSQTRRQLGCVITMIL